RSQFDSREALLALQWRRQQELARHAFETVPFYRERWSALGITPADLRTPGDWSRLPVLDRQDIARHTHDLMSSRAPRGPVASTSGSSGSPLAVLRSHLSWAHAHANVFRGWHWHGVEIGDRYAYFWGAPLLSKDRSRARLRDAFFNRDRCSAFALDRDLARR